MTRLPLLAAAWAIAATSPARAADLDEVKARGVLRHLGVPYANFVSGAGDGMEVELTQAFAKSLGVRYEYVATDWGTAIPDFIGKKLKVAGGKAEVVGDAEVNLGEAVRIEVQDIGCGIPEAIRGRVSILLPIGVGRGEGPKEQCA